LLTSEQADKGGVIEASLAETPTGREEKSPLPELASVLVRFDHVARLIVNENDSIVRVSDEDLHKN
jgi:hypothetical protein